MEGWLQTFVEILLGTMVSVNWLGPLAPDSQTVAASVHKDATYSPSRVVSNIAFPKSSLLKNGLSSIYHQFPHHSMDDGEPKICDPGAAEAGKARAAARRKLSFIWSWPPASRAEECSAILGGNDGQMQQCWGDIFVAVLLYWNVNLWPFSWNMRF